MSKQVHDKVGQPDCLKATAGAVLLALSAGAATAAEITPTVTVGAGVRTSFAVTDIDGASEEISDFSVNSVRIYLGGGVTDTIKFTLNTEYNPGDDKLVVMDAIARFEFSDKVNFWVGRHLPPTDRANLYGPYYSNHWNVYVDGIEDGYPSEAVGRNDGVTYWGQFGGLKVSFGASDVTGLTTGDSDVVYAGRLMYDFWDVEAGYFLNSNYYGEKDLLAIGVAGQKVSNDTAYSVDFLLEKKLGNAGVVAVEAEYAKYDGLGGYIIGGPPAPVSDGYTVLGSYLFPQMVGIGKLQVIGKYATVEHDYAGPGTVEQETMELNLGYIIKGFNARAYLFYLDTSYDSTAFSDFKSYGLGLQLQM